MRESVCGSHTLSSVVFNKKQKTVRGARFLFLKTVQVLKEEIGRYGPAVSYYKGNWCDEAYCPDHVFRGIKWGLEVV